MKSRAAGWTIAGGASKANTTTAAPSEATAQVAEVAPQLALSTQPPLCEGMGAGQEPQGALAWDIAPAAPWWHSSWGTPPAICACAVTVSPTSRYGSSGAACASKSTSGAITRVSRRRNMYLSLPGELAGPPSVRPSVSLALSMAAGP